MKSYGVVLRILHFKIIFLFFIGCASSQKLFLDETESVSKRNETLVKEEFKEEAAVFKKFKEIKPKSEKKKVQLNKAPGPRTGGPPPKTHRKLLPKKKKAKKTKAKKLEEVTSQGLSNYPADYPDDFIDFDERSEKFWHDFSPVLFTGEKAVLNVTYLGVDTGKIIISTKEDTVLGENPAFHVHARVKTASFYSYLYEVDDYCDSFIKKDNFIPLKFSLIQRQSSQNIDELQLFDRDHLTVYSFYKRVTEDKKKKKKTTELTPRFFQDPLSFIYFLRGLPMKVGAEYVFPIVNKGEVEILSAKVEKKEFLETKIGKKEAFRLKIFSGHKGDTIKGGSMLFWFSADAKKIFLQFNAEIKIGSIKGKIESYEF